MSAFSLPPWAGRDIRLCPVPNDDGNLARMHPEFLLTAMEAQGIRAWSAHNDDGNDARIRPEVLVKNVDAGDRGNPVTAFTINGLVMPVKSIL
jgi:hypothetical protein